MAEFLVHERFRIEWVSLATASTSPAPSGGWDECPCRCGCDAGPSSGPDRPRESGEPGSAGWDVTHRFHPDDYIPYTRRQAFDAASNPGGPELGSRGWLALWERRAAGEDVHIPGRSIPFTQADVREWADNPDRDRIPPPGTPAWEAWKADRAGKLGDELAQAKAELAESKAERSKLVDTVSWQADKIARQDEKIEKLESDNDRLKARVAGLEKTAESQRRHAADGAEQEGKADELKRGRRHLPTGKATGVLTAAVEAGNAIGTTSHVLTSGEGSIISAGAAMVAATYLWAKSKWEKKA